MNNSLAIVTGAGKGIGFELCKWFSDQSIDVIGISRDIRQLITVPKVDALQIDILNHDLLQSKLLPLLDQKEYENVYLIHNAGVLYNVHFESCTKEQMLEMVNVNYIAPLQLTQMLLPYLKTALKAHVVFIGSMGGYQGSVRFPGLAIYSSSKSAVASLAESLAVDYRGSHIHFNALALGAVDTDMLKVSIPETRANVTAARAAAFIGQFSVDSYELFNGQVVPITKGSPSN